MESGVHMRLAATKFQGSLRRRERPPHVRRSGPTFGMDLKGTGSITGLDRRAGLDAGE